MNDFITTILHWALYKLPTSIISHLRVFLVNFIAINDVRSLIESPFCNHKKKTVTDGTTMFHRMRVDANRTNKPCCTCPLSSQRQGSCVHLWSSNNLPHVGLGGSDVRRMHSHRNILTKHYKLGSFRILLLKGGEGGRGIERLKYHWSVNNQFIFMVESYFPYGFFTIINTRA